MVRGVFLTLAIVAGVWLVLILVLVVAGRRSMARELVSLIPNLLQLFRGLVRDPRVPSSSKLWLWVAVAWLISPIDLIPEFIPVAGPLDDAIVAALVLRHVMRGTDRNVLTEHWRGDPATLDAIIRVGTRFRPGGPGSPGAIDR
jgi:uncharacterized membrane protein YkvA (DUF1232 family)